MSGETHMKIKRIISVLLCAVVMLTITPCVSLTANAGTSRTESQVRAILDSIITNEFKPGSYFTKNGKKCSHGSLSSCNNCSLSGVLAREDVKSAVKNSGTNSKNFYSACYTCQAFASYCYTRCFNVPAMGTANGIKASSNYTTIGNVTDQKTASIKNLLMKAKAGDLIFIDDSGFRHWFVVYSVSDSGITILDNNGNAPSGGKSIGTVRKTTLAFSNSAFAKRDNIKLRRSKFLSTSGGTEPTVPVTPPAQTNVVTKWTLSVSGISETSATVRADITCTPSRLSKVGLELGTSAGNMKSVASWKVGSILTFCSVKCDGSEGPKLSPGTTYYYRFYVLRTDGKYEYSTTGNFTTKSTACTNHTYGGGTVTVNPTCTAAGTIVYKCTKCGASKTEAVKAKGHTAVALPGKAATCTATGLSEGSKCSVCNEMLTAQTEIPKLPHSYTAQTKPASCTENGYIRYTCSCGASYDETISAKGHQAGSWTTVRQPQPGVPGLEEIRCTVCRALIGTRETAPLSSFLPGDVDRDGKLTATDARLVLRIAVGLERADSETFRIADFNGDGKVTADDARSVLRKAVGLS